MHRDAFPLPDLPSAERAHAALLRAPRERDLDVELVAMVDPLRSGKVAVFVSRDRAAREATDAARHWLAALAARLAAAGVPHRERVVLGPPARSLRELGARSDLARIVHAPSRAPWPRWRGTHALAASSRPVTVVG
jgi:hypothetical protein